MWATGGVGACVIARCGVLGSNKITLEVYDWTYQVQLSDREGCPARPLLTLLQTGQEAKLNKKKSYQWRDASASLATLKYTSAATFAGPVVCGSASVASRSLWESRTTSASRSTLSLPAALSFTFPSQLLFPAAPLYISVFIQCLFWTWRRCSKNA